MGNCGPYGDDLNMDYCPQKVCPQVLSISTAICSSGTALLRSYQGTGGWNSYTNEDGCKFGYFAQFECDTSGGSGRLLMEEEAATEPATADTAGQPFAHLRR
jgi:hypothetical protein